MIDAPRDAFSSLSPEDQDRYLYLVEVIEFFQRLRIGHREGVPPDDAWVGWDLWLEDGIVTVPLFATVWAEERRYYVPDFVAHVDEKPAEGGTTAARSARPVATPGG